MKLNGLLLYGVLYGWYIVIKNIFKCNILEGMAGASRFICTGFSQRAWVRWIRISMVLAEVFWDIVSSQFCNNIWDVPVGAEMLKSLMSTT